MTDKTDGLEVVEKVKTWQEHRADGIIPLSIAMQAEITDLRLAFASAQAAMSARDQRITALEADYYAKCSELEIVHAANDARIAALGAALVQIKANAGNPEIVWGLAKEAIDSIGVIKT